MKHGCGMRGWHVAWSMVHGHGPWFVKVKVKVKIKVKKSHMKQAGRIHNHESLIAQSHHGKWCASANFTFFQLFGFCWYACLRP
jgi:hypothetical protein